MSKKANRTLIGVFVVAAIAMLTAAVIIFGSGKFFKERSEYVAYFEGSVKGLRVGAPVMFRGVRIGEVTDISLHFYRKDTTFKIPVRLILYPDKVVGIGLELTPQEEDAQWEEMLKEGLRAELQMQSLVTGQLLIQLDFYEDSPLKLYGLKELKLGPDVKEIPTTQSGLQILGKKIEQIPLDEIVGDLKASLHGISTFVSSPEFAKSLHYFKQAMRDTRDLIRHIDKKVDPLFDRVDQTLVDAQTLLQDVDHQVDPLAASIKSTSDDAGKLINNVNKGLGPIQKDLMKTTKNLRSAMTVAIQALNSVDGMVSENSELRFQIDIFLREISLAARSFRAFADYLEKNPDALIRGKVRREGQK